MDAALDWSVIRSRPAEIDRLGLHVCNVAGMRRALAGLSGKPGYVLTDGFPVRGLAGAALAMWKGDQVAACVAAASIVAKVTRDPIMCELDEKYPDYGFARHKGYSTRSHMRALAEHGPCSEHRMLVRERPGLASAAGADIELGPDNSEDANSCYPSGSGQNGPIVDVIEEHGWPTAGLAAMARGA